MKICFLFDEQVMGRFAMAGLELALKISESVDVLKPDWHGGITSGRYAFLPDMQACDGAIALYRVETFELGIMLGEALRAKLPLLVFCTGPLRAPGIFATAKETGLLQFSRCVNPEEMLQQSRSFVGKIRDNKTAAKRALAERAKHLPRIGMPR